MVVNQSASPARHRTDYGSYGGGYDDRRDDRRGGCGVVSLPGLGAALGHLRLNTPDGLQMALRRKSS